AIEHYRQYLAVDPTHTYVAHLVRADPVRKGRGEELRREWRKALDADPPEHDAWFGYAELCLFLGQEDEYRREREGFRPGLWGATDPDAGGKVDPTGFF